MSPQKVRPLPCPFCGYTKPRTNACHGERNGKSALAVLCDRCDACGPMRVGELPSIRAWNKRSLGKTGEAK